MLAIASLFPKPNINPATNNGQNYQFLNQTPVNRWEARIRGDWNITPKNRLYVSFNRQDKLTSIVVVAQRHIAIPHDHASETGFRTLVSQLRP